MIVSTPDDSADREPASATVLVVEDEVLIRLAIADSLRAAGYHVLEAANADEALVLLATFPEVALLFTDIQMPGSMDGAALAHFARTTFPAIGIILTSGAGMPSTEASDALVFVAKPYAPEDIVERIRTFLAQVPS